MGIVPRIQSCHPASFGEVLAKVSPTIPFFSGLKIPAFAELVKTRVEIMLFGCFMIRIHASRMPKSHSLPTRYPDCEEYDSPG